jgi:thiol-disulfide isomerase/thioredoxin
MFFRNACLAASLLIVLLSTQTAAADVHWYSALEEASSAAIRVNKPMFLDFWADWCGPCKQMEKDLYSNDAFAKAADGFVLVRINFDKKTALARKYNVEGLPTVIFTDSYGSEFIRHRGFLDVKPFIELMKALPSDVAEFNTFSKTLVQDKNNFDALQNMAMHLHDASLFLASNEYYARALQRTEAKANSATKEKIMTEMASNSLSIKDGNGAADTLERCLKEFPKSERNAEWTLNLGRAYLLADKKDKAKKLLDAFILQNPGSAEAERAKALLNRI